MTVLFAAPERVFFNFNEENIDPSVAITDDYARVAMQLDNTDAGRGIFASQTGNVWLHARFSVKFWPFQNLRNRHVFERAPTSS